jgi:glycosyltransferase involved in cell wall biosynthesis
VRICTIIAKNYVAQARVLADSFLEHHPDGSCTVLVIDDHDGYIDEANEPFEVVTPDQIDLPDYGRMASAYDVVELSTAVKPWFLRFLLDRPPSGPITYFDPDIWILDSLDEIESGVSEHGLVLIPHNTEPLPQDGHVPSELDILAAGVYNLGFVSMARRTETDRLLDWWSARLAEDCIVDPTRGYFVDQRWMDMAPALVPGVHILRDPGYNVAYWNLPTRELERDGERYRANGSPLRFFHFSGFDPTRPNALSKHQDRIDLTSSPVLAELCRRYAEACIQRGYADARTWPYDFNALPDGTRVDRYARRLYQDALDAGRLNRAIFDPEGADALISYLNEPSDVSNGNGGVTRYLRAIYDSRPDLQRAFPDLAGADGTKLVRWAHGSKDEVPIPESLLPPAVEPEAAATPDASEAVKAPSARRPAPGPDHPMLSNTWESASGWRQNSRPWGVNVAGYLNAELGVGEAARQMILALDARGVPLLPVGVVTPWSRRAHSFDYVSGDQAPFAINLICVNADMVPDFVTRASEGLLERRYSIGLWFWEVSTFPQRSHEAFEHLDEVWGASEHITTAIAEASPIPVSKVRLPVVPTPPSTASRSHLGLPEDFTFLFVFDHHSILKRKNPIGLIESFTRAFTPGSGASLVLKSINADQYPEDRDRVRAAAGEHPDVHLIDSYVSAGDKSAMIASCDCYVSLHRSEGFGLTLAEAMYFGRPVIGTGYSGNLDFMTEDNSYLVEHAMRPIGPGSEPYPAEGEWAEPDLEHAAHLLRRVFDDRDAAMERGLRGATDIRRTHSPGAAGESVERRLEEIRQTDRFRERTQPRQAIPS